MGDWAALLVLTLSGKSYGTCPRGVGWRGLCERTAGHMALTAEVLKSRSLGLSLLSGEGIEIGAFDQPSRIPPGAKVRYVDVISKAEAKKLFPEVDSNRVVAPDIIADMNQKGLEMLADGSLDFVIACHVLEHLANPIMALAGMLRVLRIGGHLVLGVPDKRFTFDRPRKITTFEHVWLDYLNRVTSSDDEHYVDFLAAVIPIHQSPPAERNEHVQRARSRHEHVHVWDSAAFAEMLLLLSIPLIGHRARLVYESIGDQNNFEHFSVWRKLR